MRSVAVRSSSRAFIAVVRSARRRSLSSGTPSSLARRACAEDRPRPRTLATVRWYTAVPTAAVATGAATVAYASLYERTRWTLRRFDVPVLAPGSRPLTVLHISDLHMTAGPERQAGVGRRAGGARARPGHRHRRQPGRHRTPSPPTLRRAGPAARPAGRLRAGQQRLLRAAAEEPAQVLPEGPQARARRRSCRGATCATGMTGRGWVDLTNARGELVVDGRRIALRRRQRPAPPAGPLRRGRRAGRPDRRPAHRRWRTPPSPGCSTGSPPTATTSCCAGTPTAGSCGCPFYGALVTNCGIDRDRVRWLHRGPPPGPDAAPGCTSRPGLGTSPYAPVRFACPPEATLLTLVARPCVTRWPGGTDRPVECSTGTSGCGAAW